MSLSRPGANWRAIARGSTVVSGGRLRLQSPWRSPGSISSRRSNVFVCAIAGRPLASWHSIGRDGRAGALNMGARHGLYCLGCCWALFAVLVAAGMMSIAWMLLLTVVVFAEKVLPHGERTSVAVGLGLITLGLVVAGTAPSVARPRARRSCGRCSEAGLLRRFTQ